MLTLDRLQAWLSWSQPLMNPLVEVWGVPVTYAEALAFALSLAMVLCNLRVNAWAWPLAISSSILFGLLLANTGLYGVAALQVVFVVLAFWGWSQWLRGRHNPEQAIRVRKLTRQGVTNALVIMVVLWAACGYLLDHITDSSMPYFDAFPTAASVVGQWMLARKNVENWPVWLVVNVLSAALFASQNLWLSALLYVLFSVLSVLGWREWLKLAAAGKSRA